MTPNNILPIRIAITGASGFIGTNLIQFYVGRGYKVINVDIIPPINKEHLKYWRKADILDKNALWKEISDFAPQYLIHMAARTDLDETVDVSGYSVNTTGVNNIIDAINDVGGVKRTIFTSSMLVCQRDHIPENYDDYMPSTLYGKSKVIGEQIVKNTKNIMSEWIIIRPTSIWGPWFGEPYGKFFELILNGKYVHPGMKTSSKTFGYIDNLVYQIDKLLFFDAKDVNHKTFYLGDYVPLNISEWADQIAKVSGKRPIRRVPFVFFKIMAIMGDGFRKIGFKGFPMTSFRLKNMMEGNIINISDIRKLAPSLPYSLTEGIIQTLKWIEEETCR
jgi:nucleoside-diphosphate-sugar epimerase